MGPILTILDPIFDFLFEVFLHCFIREMYCSTMFNLEMDFHEEFAPYHCKLGEMEYRSALVSISERISKVIVSRKF